MLKVDNKLFVSWTDIEGLVQELWKKVVVGSMPVNSIHGLKRGGYIPAVMLSHQLNLPYSEAPTIWGKEVGDEWIVYPWERNDSRAIQDYKL